MKTTTLLPLLVVVVVGLSAAEIATTAAANHRNDEAMSSSFSSVFGMRKRPSPSTIMRAKDTEAMMHRSTSSKTVHEDREQEILQAKALLEHRRALASSSSDAAAAPTADDLFKRKLQAHHTEQFSLTNSHPHHVQSNGKLSETPLRASRMVSTPQRSHVRSLQASLVDTFEDNVCEHSEVIVLGNGVSQVTLNGRTDEVSQYSHSCGAISQNDDIDSFMVVGTGKPFYATTCGEVANEFDTMITVQESTGDAGCDIDGFTCVGMNAYRSCPGDVKAADMVWNTTEGALYHIVVGNSESFTPRPQAFSLMVGEIGGETDAALPSNDICEMATPITLTDGFASIVASNENASPTSGYQGCSSDDFGSLWYSIVGNGQKMVVSTCSDMTTLDSSIAVLESKDGTCNRDGFICKENAGSSHKCDLGSHPIVSWISQPGITYFIQPYSSYIGTSGQFEMTITEEKPSSFEICNAQATRFQRENVGVECSCDLVKPYDGTYKMVCEDFCLYCDGDDDVDGSSTDNRCHTRTYEATFLDVLVSDYKNTSTFTNGGINSTITYSLFHNGTCALGVDDQFCRSCGVQACGHPVIDCTNLYPSLPMIDLCSPTADVVSPSAATDEETKLVRAMRDMITGSGSDTCTLYPSETKCAGSKNEIELEFDHLNCFCELDNDTGSSYMSCNMTCGFLCNSDESVCAVESRYLSFHLNGDRSGEAIEYNYRVGLDSFLHVEVDPQFEDFCIAYGGGQSCDCVMAQCPNSDDDTKLPQITCTSRTDNSVSTYDYCQPSVVEDGIFQVLSTDDFNTCIDLSPANAVCNNAMSVQADGVTITGSTKFVQTGINDDCEDPQLNGIWYTIVGDGTFLKISTVDSLDPATAVRVSVRKGECGNIMECLTTTDYYGRTNFFAEAGVTYHLFVSQRYDWQDDLVEFPLTIEPSSESYSACEVARAEFDDKNFVCQCYEYKESDYKEGASLSCTSICDEICVDDLSVCIFNHAFDFFDLEGKLVERSRTFRYTKGIDGHMVWQMNLADNECGVGHFTSDGRYDGCGSCAIKECPDGSMMPEVDCSNLPRGDIFDFCNPITVDDTVSIFAAFDDTNFDTCTYNGTVAPTSTPSASPTSNPIAATAPQEETGKKNDQAEESQNRKNNDGNSNDSAEDENADGSGSPSKRWRSGILLMLVVLGIGHLL